MGLLALIEQAYAAPSQGRGEIAAYLYRNGSLRGGDIDATYTTFVERALSAMDGDVSDPHAAEIRALFARLAIRCQLLASGAQERLGIPKVRDALINEIRSAFPAEPLLGNSLGEVLLQADYQSEAELYSRARASDQVEDWTRIPDEAIDRAFQSCTVFSYLSCASWSFYMPAFMIYALRHPVSLCERWTVDAIVRAFEREDQLPPQMVEWTMAQGRSVTGFVGFVTMDYEPRYAVEAAGALRNLRGRFGS